MLSGFCFATGTKHSSSNSYIAFFVQPFFILRPVIKITALYSCLLTPSQPMDKGTGYWAFEITVLKPVLQMPMYLPAVSNYL
jgi:hypothetical protein